jgi:hypothetical protein
MGAEEGTMPGIVVNTSVRTGPSTINQSQTASWFVVGFTERGPSTEAKLVTSLTDYESVFGDYVSYGAVHQQVQTFFEEGGAQVYVSRVVGASATAGVLQVPNTDSGTALTLTAVGQGDWSSTMTATLTALGSGKTLKLYIADDLVYASGEVATAAALVNKINGSTVASKYITATIGTGTFDNIASATQFSAGDDNRSGVTDATWTTALGDFGYDLGAGAVSMPGLVTSGNITDVHTAILDHCYENHRIAVLSTPSNYTATEAADHAESLGSEDYSEYGGLFWPWVKATKDDGTAIVISPEGFVAAKRSIAHNRTGSWAAYAGVVTESRWLTGLNDTVTKTVSNTLDESRVNTLRIINGRIRVYGARSLSGDEDNYRFLNSREMLNFIVVQSEAVLEDLVFSPIDGRSALFTRVKGRLVAMLEPIRIAGGLYEAFDGTGRRIDYGYSVVVNDSINPLSQLAGGLVKAKVGVRISSIGDQIQVDVTKSNLTASVV